MNTNIIAAIITSGTVSAIISYYLATRQEERKYRQQKLEKLYMCVTQWIKSFGVYSLNYRGAMQGKLSLNDVYDLTKNASELNDKTNIENIEMIIGIYFPSLQINHNELMNCRQAVVGCIIEFETTAKSGKVYKDIYVPKLDKELDKLDHIEDAYKKAIIREGNVLLKPWWRFWH